jgi:hypothetical protein
LSKERTSDARRDWSLDSIERQLVFRSSRTEIHRSNP